MTTTPALPVSTTRAHLFVPNRLGYKGWSAGDGSVEILVGLANVMKKPRNSKIEQESLLHFRIIQLEETAPILSPTSVQAEDLLRRVFCIAQMPFKRKLPVIAATLRK